MNDNEGSFDGGMMYDDGTKMIQWWFILDLENGMLKQKKMKGRLMIEMVKRDDELEVMKKELDDDGLLQIDNDGKWWNDEDCISRSEKCC